MTQQLILNRTFPIIQFLVMFSIMIGGFVAGPNFLMAQSNSQTQADGDEEEKPIVIPPVEKLVLQTSDKIKLSCNLFLPGHPEDARDDVGHSVVPIIMLHDWGATKETVGRYANFLQKQGFAVITPDLRGHGESKSRVDSKKELDYQRFNKQQVASTLSDLERCKKELVRLHNKGKLNVDLLVVMSVGETAALATQWIIDDWFAFPEINQFGIKQGRDVKALIMVAPRKKLESIGISGIVKHQLYTGLANGKALPTLFVWSRNNKVAKDSKYIYDIMEKKRPKPDEDADEEARKEAKDLFKVELNGDWEAEELMASPVLRGKLWNHIANFIKAKVADKAESRPWKNRERN